MFISPTADLKLTIYLELQMLSLRMEGGVTMKTRKSAKVLMTESLSRLFQAMCSLCFVVLLCSVILLAFPVQMNAESLWQDLDVTSPILGDDDYDRPVYMSKIRDYLYTLKEDGTASLILCADDGEGWIIPSELDGYKVTGASSNAFSYSYPYLTHVTIPGFIKTIERGAFYWCDYLQEVYIEEGVETIEVGAFMGCSSLRYVSLPDSVSIVGGSPFEDCQSLETIDVRPSHPTLTVHDHVLFDKQMERLICYPGGLTAEEYRIPSGVKYVSSFAFGRNSHLRSIEVPDGVEVIGTLTFFECEKLTSLLLPDSVEKVGHMGIGGCYELTSFHVPAKLTYLGDMAFSIMEKVPSFDLPDTLTHIGEDALVDTAIMYVVPGSYAEQYLMDHGIPCHYK